MDQRVCVRCDRAKRIDEFPSLRGRVHGARCLACLAEIRRIERASRPKAPPSLRDRDLKEKRCNRCGITKPVAEFYWAGRKWSYLCRECTMEDRRKYRAENLELVRATGRATEARLGPNRRARYRALKSRAPVVEKIDRAAIIERDKSTCYLCGAVVSGRQLTLDHLVPLIRGGEHSAANLRVCCRSCNCKKRHLTTDEYLSRIRDPLLS